MKNEIEICRVFNQTSVMKRELDQKEKTVEDLHKDMNEKSDQDKVLEEKINNRIKTKEENLRSMRTKMRERDQEIEFLEFLLKEKS